MTRIQVKLTIGDKDVIFDGPEDFVRAEVQRLTNNLVAASPTFVPTVPSIPASEEGKSTQPRTEREFLDLKKPRGHSEIVAALAYFLTKSGQEQFTAADIKRAYARAHERPPKAIDQALRDAKNLHDYLQSGSDRGTFRLSPHGDRTVTFDLPRKET